MIAPLPHEGRAFAGEPGPAPRGKVIVAATRQFPRNGEGSFLAVSGGKLVYFYGAWPTTSDSARETCLAKVVSADGGDSWSQPAVVLKEAGQDLYHPCAVRTGDGAVGLAYTKRRSGTKLAEKVFRRSRDEGATWSGETTISDGAWKHYITGAHDRLVRLESGRLIIPVFMAELNSAVKIDGKAVAAALVFASDDHGRTWRRMTPEPLCIRDGRANRNCEEPCIVEHAPGKLLMVMRTLRGWLYQCRSEDNGRTWSRPARSTVANPRAPARLERIPGTGTILMVHNPHVSGEGWHKGARVILAARTSRDGGRTWSDPRQIEHTGADTWYDYPSVYWTGDVLHLAYRSVPRGGKGWKRVDVRYQRLAKAWLTR